MNEIVEKFNNENVTYILSENRDDMYLDVETIAQVFNTSRQNIAKHLGKLKDSRGKETNSFSSLTVPDSIGRMRKKLYNLDVVIEIGYMVKSPQASEFRMWANNILKQYIMAPAKPSMVHRLADAMGVDMVTLAEENKELKSQVQSMANRLGEQRALEKEVFALKEEVARSKIEIADLYGKLSNIQGNYWRRELEKVQEFVNHSLDEYR